MEQILNLSNRATPSLHILREGKRIELLGLIEEARIASVYEIRSLVTTNRGGHADIIRPVSSSFTTGTRARMRYWDQIVPVGLFSQD